MPARACVGRATIVLCYAMRGTWSIDVMRRTEFSFCQSGASAGTERRIALWKTPVHGKPRYSFLSGHSKLWTHTIRYVGRRGRYHLLSAGNSFPKFARDFLGGPALRTRTLLLAFNGPMCS